MTIALGIDTGGTYTDAALVDLASGDVLSAAKALTTYHDLTVGIGEAVAKALDHGGCRPDQVAMVGLSTTLATNAIVEGRGGRVCLLLIGYDPELIQQYGFQADLAAEDVVYLRGGHDGAGNEVAPLDEEGAREAVLKRRGQVEAFAISGYFAVRNPEHERRVRALVEQLMPPIEGHPFPVTCGHELTSRLNSVRRAMTAALNARLIPILRDLIATARRTLDGLGVTAPLMVVRGDGSLVRAEWAMRRPIETVLSGPAASVVGARHLAGQAHAWVIDIGGTTTDIAALRDGWPQVNPDGAQVGRWRTMVEAVDVHTVGLGGDSEVTADVEGRLTIGPRRVAPLCMLAAEHPGMVDVLRDQLGASSPPPYAGQFALALCDGAPGLAEADRELLRELAAGPVPLAALHGSWRHGPLAVRRLEGLEARRLVLRSAFTPTDALHVLGRFRRWDVEAAGLGAEVLARILGTSPEALCRQIVEQVSQKAATELVHKLLGDEGVEVRWADEPTARALLDRALGRVPGSDLACRLRLRRPIVAIGAPAEAYIPRAAEYLGARCVVPPHAEVANAVGAVVGGVVLRRRVLIRPLGAKRFRLHLPEGVEEFDSVEVAVARAQEAVPPVLREQARQAGAEQVEIDMARRDQTAPVGGGWGRRIYLGTELEFIAVGRPSVGVTKPQRHRGHRENREILRKTS